MANQFNKAALRICVAQICQNVGWHAIHHSALDILVDILQRHIKETARSTKNYANQYNRTEPNLDDVGLAFRDIGIVLHELEDYVNNVEPVLFVRRLPPYPLPHSNNLQFSKHPEARSDYYEEYHPSLQAPVEEDEALNSAVEAIKNEQDVLSASSALSKGGTTKLPEYLDANKKIRLAPEEEGQSAKETASVFMTPSGFVTPMREGKVPDPCIPSKLVKDLPGDSDDDDYLSDGSLSDERALSPIVTKPLSTTAIVKDIKRFKSIRKPSLFPSKKKVKSPTKASAAGKEKPVKARKAPRKKKPIPTMSPEPELFSVNEMTPLQVMAAKAEEELNRRKQQQQQVDSANKKKIKEEIEDGDDASDNSRNLLIDEPSDDRDKTSRLASIDDVISKVIEEAREESRRQVAMAVEDMEAKSKRHSGSNKSISKSPPPLPLHSPAPAAHNSPRHVFDGGYGDDDVDRASDVESRPKTPDFATNISSLPPVLSPKEVISPKRSPLHSPPFSLTVKTLAERKAMSPVPTPIIEKSKHKEKKKAKEKQKVVLSSREIKSASRKSSSNKRKKLRDEDAAVPRLTLKFGASGALAKSSKGALKALMDEDDDDEDNDDDDDNDSDVSFEPSSSSRKRKRPTSGASPCPPTSPRGGGGGSDLPPPPPLITTETCGTTYDEQGNKIWICPACAKPDDGSPMIGCDDCDDWYHWECVGIKVPPKEEVSWYCGRCLAKRKASALSSTSSPPTKKKKKKHRRDK